MVIMYDVHSHTYVQHENVLTIQQLKLSDQIFETPFSISVHPWDVETPYNAEQLYQYAMHINCLAIGETGLDKLHGNIDVQKHVFLEHIKLAKRVNKPLILHCVRAFEDCIALLKQEQFSHGVLFHGFNKHPNLAQQLIKKGYYIGLGASFLKENPNFERFLVESNFENILFETDMNSELDIKSLYQKAQDIHPLLDVVETITKTFNNWREK